MTSIPREDFLVDENGDFPLEDTIINGVYQNTPYGNSDDQHKIDNVFYAKGAIAQYPLFGFGIVQYQNSEYDADNVYSALQQQVSTDGYKLNNGAVIPGIENGFAIDTDFIVPNY